MMTKLDPKLRRLVDRVIRLHIEKATTLFHAPDQRVVNRARNRLANRAQKAKRELLMVLAETERLRIELRECREVYEANHG